MVEKKLNALSITYIQFLLVWMIANSFFNSLAPIHWIIFSKVCMTPLQNEGLSTLQTLFSSTCVHGWATVNTQCSPFSNQSYRILFSCLAFTHPSLAVSGNSLGVTWFYTSSINLTCLLSYVFTYYWLLPLGCRLRDMCPTVLCMRDSW